jgi:CRISPR/Cas system CSM-associated protein Csm3 (group 7 of RAMP superfamily)
MTDAQIIGRILVKGELVLKSPLLIGDGAGETADNFKDIHVLKNQDGVPFIPGTSICGVLREEFKNFEVLEELFGDANKFQSAIQIEDTELKGGEIISRDGVKIDSLTGTGVAGAKYDYEAVERGARGNFRMIVNLRGYHKGKDFKSAVAEILGKLESGIRLGALTSKGFGFSTVEKIDAEFYDFTKKADVRAWFTGKPASTKIKPAKKISADAENFVVDADFVFNSSFIVRDYEVSADEKADKISAVSLKSLKDFVIPGTSLKGIFRYRAEYIFNKLNLEVKLLNNLMGNSDNDEKIKSRFIVAESYVESKNVVEVSHARNKIDRFTGGTLQGALFKTKPVYQKNIAPTLHVHFEIIAAADFEAGLAILLLRDLWLGKVAVGGEKGIGRGTLKGISAKINFNGKTYELGTGGKVIQGDAEELSKFAKEFSKFVSTVKNGGETE